MTDQAALMTRYLLGELSEAEREAFEARYFEDPRVFAELADVESALVDDYVRRRLTPEVRRQFEAFYLADPARRERVRFAEALVSTIDRVNTAAKTPTRRQEPSSPWPAWLGAIRAPRFAMAAAMLVLAAAGIWLVLNAPRTPRVSSTTAGGGPGPAATSVQPGDSTTATGVPTPGTTQPGPNAPPPPVVAIATLALTVGPGERAAAIGEPPTLTIPPDTEQVRLALTLREHDYARYRVSIRAVGGGEVFRLSDLIPIMDDRTPAFTLTMPAPRLQTGDYLLTLQGASAAGEFEDLSQTLFRVR
jgi:anti-sigma factor RsiW